MRPYNGRAIPESTMVLAVMLVSALGLWNCLLQVYQGEAQHPCTSGAEVKKATWEVD